MDVIFDRNEVKRQCKENRIRVQEDCMSVSLQDMHVFVLQKLFIHLFSASVYPEDHSFL